MFGGKKRVKEQILEINYVKENKVLQEILKISYNTKDIKEAIDKIVKIMLDNYKIDFCSLFLFKDGNMTLSGTNIPKEINRRVEEFANAVYETKIIKEEADAFVLKSENPLDYDTAWERGIKYMMFMPLKIDSTIGGFLIENREASITKEEMEFYELIVENITLIIQNLIYFKKIMDLANQDGLTGVYNRNYMNEHLTKYIARAAGINEKFSIAIFDIDHFKKFNDTYGHLHGDKVLKEISKYVNKAIRDGDELYRYGGEEFIIYLKGTYGDEAYNLIEEIRRGIEALNITTDKDEITKVTASFGISEFPKDDTSRQGLIEKADACMYTAKNAGRNRVIKM